MIKHKKARKKPPIIDAIKIPRKKKEVKLDLACGDAKKEGFQGVDRFKTPSTDFTLNLLKFPWPRKAPFRTNSVDALHCSHFFEHVPQHLRGKFMDEVWRVLKPGMRIEIICPYCSTLYRFAADLKPGEARPPECVLKDKVA